jgi:hypothetical protein
MSDFSFTATAECDLCGRYLSSSDEDCDHGGHPVETHVFRRLFGGRDSMTGVESTVRHKWHKLEEKVGDDWIAYQYLGPRCSVTTMLNGTWDSVEDLPVASTSVDAPDDVGEDDE